jgi:hypothetical protein
VIKPALFDVVEMLYPLPEENLPAVSSSPIVIKIACILPEKPQHVSTTISRREVGVNLF